MGPRGAAALLLAATCLSTAPAAAYDYSEHAFVSHEALRALEKRRPMAAALSHVIASTDGTTCAAQRLISQEAPKDCLTAADIPALAGDHAPSPVMTKWRWFDGEIEPDELALFWETLYLPFSVMGEDKGPEERKVGKPSPSGLIEYRAAFASHTWGASFERMSNYDLLGHDKSYVRLAASGHPHFRQRLSVATGSRLGGRRTYVLDEDRDRDPDHPRVRHKPQLEAYAWYADLHLGALWFARLARDASADPGRRRLFEGVAWFLELNAWHYLQDGVSAGHFIGDIDVLEATTLHATHDHYGEVGVEATPTRDLREAAADARGALADAGAPSGSPRAALRDGLDILARMPTATDPAAAKDVTLHGDGVLATSPDRAKTSIAWATLLSYLSGVEVQRVLDSASSDAGLFSDSAGPRLTRLGACPDADPVQDPVFTALFSSGGPDRIAQRRSIYRCLHAWWDATESHEERRSDIIRAANHGFLRPAFLLPEPKKSSTSLPQFEFFSGGGLGLNVGMAHTIERDWVPSFGFNAFAGAPRYVGFGLIQVGVQATIIPPTRGLGAEAGRGVGPDGLAVGFGGEWRPFWHHHPVMSSVRLGLLWLEERDTFYFDATVTPVALLLEDGEDIAFALGPTWKWNEAYGWGTGLVLDVGWWPNE